jgi:hypothetical protein
MKDKFKSGLSVPATYARNILRLCNGAYGADKSNRMATVTLEK